MARSCFRLSVVASVFDLAGPEHRDQGICLVLVVSLHAATRSSYSHISLRWDLTASGSSDLGTDAKLVPEHELVDVIYYAYALGD
jgi:hypothetical protein